MKKSTSLRTKLILLMTLIVIFQNITLIMSLSFSKVFYKLDEESFRVFNNVSNSRQQVFNQEIGQLIINVTDEARSISKKFQNINKTSSDPDYDKDVLYNHMAAIGANHLIHLLQNNSVSGAFFILNDNKEAKFPSVFIRNSTPNITKSNPENFLLEVGPISVSSRYSVPTTENWSIDFPINLADTKENFYLKPLQAALDYPHAEIERYGYWTKPTSILKDSPSAFYYTLPLFDKNSSPIGIIGVEISLNHFAQYYLPLIDLPYKDSFHIITPMQDNQLTMNWFVSSNPLSRIYLPSKKSIELTTMDITNNSYTTKLQGL